MTIVKRCKKRQFDQRAMRQHIKAFVTRGNRRIKKCSQYGASTKYFTVARSGGDSSAISSKNFRYLAEKFLYRLVCQNLGQKRIF